jgi:hypothetical protein
MSLLDDLALNLIKAQTLLHELPDDPSAQTTTLAEIEDPRAPHD